MRVSRTFVIGAILTLGLTAAAKAQIGSVRGTVSSRMNTDVRGTASVAAAAPAVVSAQQDGSALMRGIVLTAEQKTQVDGIFRWHDPELRQAANAQQLQERRAAMQKELRSVLTAEQQATFDANVAAENKSRKRQ
jgi:Spy/CpxP family protein refolding chaperone